MTCGRCLSPVHRCFCLEGPDFLGSKFREGEIVKDTTFGYYARIVSVKTDYNYIQAYMPLTNTFMNWGKFQDKHLVKLSIFAKLIFELKRLKFKFTGPIR